VAINIQRMSRSGLRLAVAGVILWVILLAVLSIRGFFSDFSALPPRLSFALLIPLAAVLFFVRSRAGTAVLRRIQPQWLIYLQTFRILVEMGLWLSVRNGLLPVQLSFEGRNFDLLTGLIAIPVGYYCFVRRSWPPVIALLFNIGGLLMLVNAVTLATLSMPTPLQAFHGQPDASLLTRFPGIFLPGLLVPLAYTLHIFSLRQWRIIGSVRQRESRISVSGREA